MPGGWRSCSEYMNVSKVKLRHANSCIKRNTQQEQQREVGSRILYDLWRESGFILRTKEIESVEQSEQTHRIDEEDGQLYRDREAI